MTESEESAARLKIEEVVASEWLFTGELDRVLAEMLKDRGCENDEIEDHLSGLLANSLGTLGVPVEGDPPRPFNPVSHIQHVAVFEDDRNRAVVEVEMGYCLPAPPGRRSKWTEVAERELVVNLRSETIESSRVTWAAGGGDGRRRIAAPHC